MHPTSNYTITVGSGGDFATGGWVHPTDGESVKRAIETAEADERTKRIAKLTKKHRKAWYASPTPGDVAVFTTGGGKPSVAIAALNDDKEIRWEIAGKPGGKTFAELVKHFVDHDVAPDTVGAI